MSRNFNSFITGLEENNVTEIRWKLLLIRFVLIILGILIIIADYLTVQPDLPSGDVVDIGIEWGFACILLGILAISYSKRITFYWENKELVIQTKILWFFSVKTTFRPFSDIFSLSMRYGYYPYNPRMRYSHRRGGPLLLPGNVVEFFLVFNDGSQVLLDYTTIRLGTPLTESKLFPQLSQKFIKLTERLELDLNYIDDGIYVFIQMLKRQIKLRLLH